MFFGIEIRTKYVNYCNSAVILIRLRVAAPLAFNLENQPEQQTRLEIENAPFELQMKQAKKIFTWASQNTFEVRQYTPFKYYWTTVASRLLTTLKLSAGTIIALVGLSGVGKSSMQQEVVRALNKDLHCDGLTEIGTVQKNQEISANDSPVTGRAIHFKWPGYLDENYDRILGFLELQKVVPSFDLVAKYLIEKISSERSPKLFRRRVVEIYGKKVLEDSQFITENGISSKDLHNFLEKLYAMKNEEDRIRFASQLLAPSDLRSFQREIMVTLLAKCHTIMIDLRDYGMRDARGMNTDLTEIQKLWQLICEYYSKEKKPHARIPNIVFVLQKELAISENSKFSHYFLGKASMTLQIPPMAPEQMAEAYRNEFGSYFPFTKDGIEAVAYVSRGLFRAFLRYIQICLQYFMMALADNQKTGDPTKQGHRMLNKQFVLSIVTPDELVSGWETELRQIFPRGSSWEVAYRLLTLLTIKPQLQNDLEGQITIKQGEKWLSPSSSEISRTLQKLEEYGFVRREYTDGGKMVYPNMARGFLTEALNSIVSKALDDSNSKG